MPGLDGLRGLAVVVVVLFHAGHLTGGYLGVDLFFVLSGYLITSLLLVEGTASGTLGLARFWGRRARRLLPALGVLVVGVAAYAAFVAEPEELHRIRWDGIATMLYVANWREIFGGSDYWALFTAPSPLAHTWSLAIEEQFYVVWPLVVVGVLWWVGRRRSRADAGEPEGAEAAGRSLGRNMLVLCAVLAAVALGSQAWWQSVAGWNRVYFGTDTRAFALLCGAGLASFTAWRGSRAVVPPAPTATRRRRGVLEAVGCAGAVFLAAAFVFMSGSSTFAHHGGLASCSVAGAAVIAAVSHPRPGLLARALSFRPLVGIGLISYGVYLYHWPIAVWLSSERVGMSGWPLLALQSAVTLAVAVVSYRFVEQPIRHRSGWSLRRVALMPSVGFVAVGALLLLATVAALPRSTDVSPAALAAAARSSGRDGRPSIMIIGNSVAWYLAGDGFDEVTTRPSIRFVNNGHPNCQYPMTDRLWDQDGSTKGPGEIHACKHRWFETAEAYRVSKVVFVRSGVDPARIRIDGAFADPCSATYEDYYAATLRADIDRFARLGATTVLVTSIPSKVHFGQSPDYYRSYLRSVACGNDVLQRVAAADTEHVQLVDLEAHLCSPSGSCAETLDGTVLRKDGTHFKGRAARLVAAWILSRVGIEATPDS